MSNPATQEDADEASSTASVLLVDDEPNVLKSLNRLLRRRGYVVHMCTCPEQALKLLEQLDPKVIVSDYRMPQMNGVEFLHRARQLRPRAMRILLSGQADREVIIEAVNDGEIARYLDKPWDDQELVDVIEAADRVANERAEDVARSMALEHDVTEIRSRLDEAVAALERARECDVVTGLPNRSAFVARAERLMCSNAERTHEVLVLGLGGLDLVRASEGYEGADALLCEVSRKVAGQVRDEDLVARVGDDLFAILLDDAHGIAGAERVARRILEELARPTYHAGRALLITGKIGIACAPEHGERAETLLTNAQTALTLARSSGLQMDVYSPGMTDEAHSRLRLEHRLRLAVESEAFTLAYQPRFRASDGRLIAAEALLRWHDEELGHIGPGQFVPVLESTGMIVTVGRWVVRQAAQALARWRRLGHADLAVSVNVSAIQFRLDDISAVVSAALGEVGESQSPDRLELELTETLMIGDRDEDLEVLVRLSRNGIPLAMDDFGTGYSSLSYLVKMPFQVVKIDRQFIQRMCAEEQVYRVVQAIIAMSHALNMRVVAEGVETHEQQHALRALGCDELQGYLLSRPLSEQSFLELVSELRNGKPVDDATQGGLRVELAHAARPVEDSSAVTRMLDAGATRVGAAGSS